MSGERTDALRQDALLVARAAAGDQASWDQLVDRYAQFVWDTATRYRLDASLAADVCVVTWLRCADHLDEIFAGGNLREWLTASVAREAGDVLLASSPAPAGVSGTLVAHVVQRPMAETSDRTA